jgi:hypothetical protein
MSVLVDCVLSAWGEPIPARTKPSHTIHDERHPHWPVLSISLGLLASLAWNGSLAWIAGRTIGIW